MNFLNQLIIRISKSGWLYVIVFAGFFGTLQALQRIADRFPERAFDTGICESHAMDMMAGMAKTGLRPFFAVYSTFLQRGYDQVVHDVAVQKLPVRFAIDRAGLVGQDGPTHAFLLATHFTSLPKPCKRPVWRIPR